MEAPAVNVGILTQKTISFVFNEEYIHAESGDYIIGEQYATLVNDNIVYNGKLYQELFFEPASPKASFDLKSVTIGVQFHWERQEDLRFHGALNLVISNGSIVAINQIQVEDYLTSVISSEMSATASAELLKAHAVISRSWLLAQIEKNNCLNAEPSGYQSCLRTNEELVRWYDREDHDLFDVCADDHCQRYQGITRASTPIVQQAVEETQGEILTDGIAICDARYSKCCGGVTERFEHCWEPVPHSYLTALRDSKDSTCPDLSREDEAEQWIRATPEAFCNTTDKTVLGQVLNNYDQETADFYRWQVSYTNRELSDLILRRSGLDFGELIDLVPLQRGTSGRIERLKIIGTRLTYIIGKELEIRRSLSETHLYSSAFVVDKEEVKNNIPQRFRLTGAGWGHGVGLCQIGAAMMGAKGYGYKEILAHYFRGATVEKRY
ncbi:MAG: SpoIID/LytB domain-containing protein [Tannerellaceae bacterium]